MDNPVTGSEILFNCKIYDQNFYFETAVANEKKRKNLFNIEMETITAVKSTAITTINITIMNINNNSINDNKNNNNSSKTITTTTPKT